MIKRKCKITHAQRKDIVEYFPEWHAHINTSVALKLTLYAIIFTYKNMLSKYLSPEGFYMIYSNLTYQFFIRQYISYANSFVQSQIVSNRFNVNLRYLEQEQKSFLMVLEKKLLTSLIIKNCSFLNYKISPFLECRIILQQDHIALQLQKMIRYCIDLF